MGRKILVAVDEGEESLYALSWCLKNLLYSDDDHKNNSDDTHTIILLFAKTPLPIYSLMDTTGPTGHVVSPSIIASVEKYANEVADKVMHKATQLCQHLGNHQIKVETMMEHGDPRDVICQVAERLKVDFLVIGTHGYGFIKRAFLGSVSNHCAQNVQCPVLIVKKPKSNAAADH